jgi:hypothetical protein
MLTNTLSRRFFYQCPIDPKSEKLVLCDFVQDASPSCIVDCRFRRDIANFCGMALAPALCRVKVLIAFSKSV